MTSKGWRYLLPNAVTSASVVIATVAVEQAMTGRVVSAAWLALLCMITDKLDGLVAKSVGASSEFGVQLDSLADLVSFGVAPAAIYYAFFHARPDWSERGWPLGGLCALHVLAVALRLAQFNVTAAKGAARKHYLGLPSTMTAAFLFALFLFAVKYAPDAGTVAVDRYRVLPIDTTAFLRWLPLVFPVAAVAMLCRVRVPRIGRTGSAFWDAGEILGIVLGLVSILFRQLPEYLLAAGSIYLVACVVHHLRTRVP